MHSGHPTLCVVLISITEETGGTRRLASFAAKFGVGLVALDLLDSTKRYEAMSSSGGMSGQ